MREGKNMGSMTILKKPTLERGWGGGGELGSKHPWPLPPHPCLPPRWGEGADAAVMHGENRELNSPGRPWPAYRP